MCLGTGLDIEEFLRYLIPRLHEEAVPPPADTKLVPLVVQADKARSTSYKWRTCDDESLTLQRNPAMTYS